MNRGLLAVLLACLAASQAHFWALSPERFAGPSGHHRILSPWEVPERYLAIPRVRHGDPSYAGASDAAGYIRDAEVSYREDVPKGMRHPLLTYLTAALFRIVGYAQALYYGIPLAFYLGSLVLVWFVARELFGERAALAAALLAGLHPTIMASSFSYNSHAISPFFNLAALACFLGVPREPWLWVPLMALTGLGRLARLENIVLAGVFPILAWGLRRAFRERFPVRFGLPFAVGAAAWLAVTGPYHYALWRDFGNPFHPFELSRLLVGQVDDLSSKYTGHEGPVKMFALFFLTGSWLWPFLFWRGIRAGLLGADAPRVWGLLGILAVWFAGFSVQAVTDPGGIHVVFGMELVAIGAAGGLASLTAPLRRDLLAYLAIYSLTAQAILIHFCQFLYGEGHLVIWGLKLEGLKAWLVSLPFWKFGNP